jgi:hypothetical protein
MNKINFYEVFDSKFTKNLFQLRSEFDCQLVDEIVTAEI